MCACNHKSKPAVEQASLQTVGSMTSAFVSDALTRSPSFVELKRRSKRATFVVDVDAPDSILVGIGEDMDSHFTRFKTLKIDKKTGIITRLETDQKLDDKWQVEFQPKN